MEISLPRRLENPPGRTGGVLTPLISVALPTIPGREASLERAVRAYYAPYVEILLVPDSPTCGYGWTAGADRATGDYIHFGADDVEMLPGWAGAAIACCEAGRLPAPLVLNPDGSIQSCGGSWGALEEDWAETEFSRGPFIKREWWEWIRPVPAELHYYTDNYISDRCRARGIIPTVCVGYTYCHHLAPSPFDRSGRQVEDAARYQDYR